MKVKYILLSLVLLINSFFCFSCNNLVLDTSKVRSKSLFFETGFRLYNQVRLATYLTDNHATDMGSVYLVKNQKAIPSFELGLSLKKGNHCNNFSLLLNTIRFTGYDLTNYFSGYNSNTNTFYNSSIKYNQTISLLNLFFKYGYNRIILNKSKLCISLELGSAFTLYKRTLVSATLLTYSSSDGINYLEGYFPYDRTKSEQDENFRFLSWLNLSLFSKCMFQYKCSSKLNLIFGLTYFLSPFESAHPYDNTYNLVQWYSKRSDDKYKSIQAYTLKNYEALNINLGFRFNL